MVMRPRAMSIGLMLAALAAPDAASAESEPDRWPAYPEFGRIRCAAASDLCAWKRRPDEYNFRWEGFEGSEVPRPRGFRTLRPPQAPDASPP
jgi:hypothetical protein